MSDIALLVAEEFERRTKNLKSGGPGVVREGEFNMVSCASLLVFTRRLKEKVEERIWEPKTQIAIAASNSFFSA
ncbi:uncharacterized protein LOC133284437 [Gastrolobium bilobum]|uniref:uncharacterized protein LOC133284437 n=1 Tax=Gastrolobium bilobum TaxID=150636 RepID=UPI002AB0CA30|nr:uncharacterized protein LOC133284437 [Gastrolobium bilobum]